MPVPAELNKLGEAAENKINNFQKDAALQRVTSPGRKQRGEIEHGFDIDPNTGRLKPYAKVNKVNRKQGRLPTWRVSD